MLHIDAGKNNSERKMFSQANIKTQERKTLATSIFTKQYYSQRFDNPVHNVDCHCPIYIVNPLLSGRLSTVARWLGHVHTSLTGLQQPCYNAGAGVLLSAAARVRTRMDQASKKLHYGLYTTTSVVQKRRRRGATFGRYVHVVRSRVEMRIDRVAVVIVAAGFGDRALP